MDTADPCPSWGAPFGFPGGDESVSSSGFVARAPGPLAAVSCTFGGGSARSLHTRVAEGAVGPSDLSPQAGWAGHAGYANGPGEPVLGFSNRVLFESLDPQAAAMAAVGSQGTRKFRTKGSAASRPGKRKEKGEVGF